MRQKGYPQHSTMKLISKTQSCYRSHLHKLARVNVPRFTSMYSASGIFAYWRNFGFAGQRFRYQCLRDVGTGEVQSGSLTVRERDGECSVFHPRIAGILHIEETATALDFEGDHRNGDGTLTNIGSLNMRPCRTELTVKDGDFATDSYPDGAPILEDGLD